MYRREDAHSFQITGDQARSLIEVLRDHHDGDAVLITTQGDGSLVVAFSLATVEITTAGTVFAD